MTHSISGDDFRPTARLDVLKRRSALLAQLRLFFAQNRYWEVDTPILSQETVVDAYLDPFELTSKADSAIDRLFLQTSPEFAMKRLLASGADRIYQITKAFRCGEIGRRHNPEFTMLEWYAVGETYDTQMDFVESLFRSLSDFDNSPFERLTYGDAFETAFGKPVPNLAADELRDLAVHHGVEIPGSIRIDDRDGFLNLLLAEQVEPNLGVTRPTFLYDYPASQSALARVREAGPDQRHSTGPVAERFELYINGIEFCNGYQELTDADELRRRIVRENTIREREGRLPLPAESRLLTAMDAGLPECSGVALGIDRLAMWLFGCESISDVIAFPFDRA
jgi:lysyl-tRNA synthetase class 2